MITSPDTYPLWKTRRPVISVNNITSDDSAQCVTRYRYLVYSPAAEVAAGETAEERLNATAAASGKSPDSGGGTGVGTGVGGGSVHSMGMYSVDSSPTTMSTMMKTPRLGNAQYTKVIEYENPWAVPPPGVAPPRDGSSPTISDSVNSLTMTGPVLSSNSLNSRFSSGVIHGAPEHVPYRTTILASETDVSEQVDTWNCAEDATFRPYMEAMNMMDASIIMRGGGGSNDGNNISRMEIEADSDDDNDAGNNMDTDAAGMSDDYDDDEDDDDDANVTPTGKGRLYLVCFHLPLIVSHDTATGEWDVVWNESLLAKTTQRLPVGDITAQYEMQWIGTATLPRKADGSSYTDEELKPLHAKLAELNCFVLFLPDDVRSAHYYGMCKQVLWPAFHNIDLLDLSEAGFDNIYNNAANYNNASTLAGDYDAVQFSNDTSIVSDWDQSRLEDWWAAYKKVNRIFSDHVCSLVTHKASEESIVWVHDYHLSLLPKYIHTSEVIKYGYRRSKMVFFLHIPFPTSQIFRELECGDAILEGMLHSNIIGFHAFDHARHFLHSCKRIKGCDYDTLVGGLIGVKFEKQVVVVDMSNVSIEVDQTQLVLELPETHEICERYKLKYANKQLIAGVDVAQRLSGVAQKLLAFERLLADYPVWQGKVVMIQRMLIPNTRKADEVSTLKQVRMLANRIKTTFSSHHVIDYMEYNQSSLKIHERLGLWLASDIYLSTVVREGLNLGPLEYIYARKEPVEAGVVIASEFSAVCSVLNGALRVNPFDVQMTASCIDKALTMPQSEKEGRRHRDIDFVSSCPSSQWTRNVLRDLNEITAMNPEVHQAQPTLKNRESTSFSTTGEPYASPFEIHKAYVETSKRVIILDFNGTLVRKEPTGKYLKREILGTSGQKPPSTVVKALKTLSSDPQNVVFVVSGDTQENLVSAIGSISGLGLAASNGACFAWPCKERQEGHEWYSFEFGDDWNAVKELALPIMSKYTARTNGSTMKLSDASIGWSYYSCDPEWGSLQARHLLVELQHQLAAFEVRFVTIKGGLEVVPKMMNKGVVVKKILREVASRNNQQGLDFVLCIGDDVTDEKMFTSVYKFKSEENDEYHNVVPSPAVKPKSSTINVPDERIMKEIQSLKYKSDPENIDYAFTITVGKKNMGTSSMNSAMADPSAVGPTTNASLYINDATEVEDILVTLAGGEVTERSMSWDFNDGGGIEYFS